MAEAIMLKKASESRILHTNGEFIAPSSSSTVAITINHNLGCKSVYIVGQAETNDDSVIQNPSSPYVTARFACAYIENWIMKEQKYQKQDDWQVVETNKSPIGQLSLYVYLPTSQTRTDMPMTVNSNDRNVTNITDNSITFNVNYQLIRGAKYVWHAYAIWGGEE